VLEGDSRTNNCVQQAAKIPRLLAPTIGIAVDYRRQNLSEESLTRNVERLKAYKSRLVVFPKKGKKPAVPENASQSIAAALPFDHVGAGIEVIKKGDMPKPEGSQYARLRKARSDQRLAGVREKRAKEKAEAESAKK